MLTKFIKKFSEETWRLKEKIFKEGDFSLANQLGLRKGEIQLLKSMKKMLMRWNHLIQIFISKT